MVAPIPSNFSVLVAGEADKTIQELAENADMSFLTPYFLVTKKENISEGNDVVAMTEDQFHQGEAAREFLGLPLGEKASIAPCQIATVCIFVQNSDPNRKIPKGSSVLLQTTSSNTSTEATPTTPTQTPTDTEPARPNKRSRTTPSPPPPPPSPSGLSSEVLSLRLQREGAREVSALQASLIWNDIADLDISCISPSGELIYYGHKESECGGWLDVDMNVTASTASKEPVENIFWASAPSGKYVFRVTNFNCHTDPNTVFVDPQRAVPFRVFLTRDGKREVFDGEVKHKEMKICFEFDHKGDGALGSFVVMPPSDAKTTFKESCNKHGVTYTQGNGYYAVCRKENISVKKVMLLQDTEKDTFTIGASACRAKLGWPEGNLRKGPKDIPEGLRLFVQSTSHNRVIPPGTHVLMKVSVGEALRHRPAHDTKFSDETHTMGKA